MMVEATYAFVKLKQIKAAVSAGGIKFTSHKVGSNTRRVIVFNICQNLKGSLIRISEFPEASVMIEQLRVGITPRQYFNYFQ